MTTWINFEGIRLSEISGSKRYCVILCNNINGKRICKRKVTCMGITGKKMFYKSKGEKNHWIVKKIFFNIVWFHLYVKSKNDKLRPTKNTGWLPKLGVGVEEMGTCWSKGTNFWSQSDEQIWDVMCSMVSVANNSASYTWMLLREEILNVLTTNKK